MFIEIEIISGKILELLDEKGKLNFYEVRKNMNEPEELITQSLQWLMRGEYVIENAMTGEYTINGLQQVCRKEELIGEINI